MEEEMVNNIEYVLNELKNYFSFVSKDEGQFWEYMFNTAMQLEKIISIYMPTEGDKKGKVKRLKKDLILILNKNFEKIPTKTTAKSKLH